MLDEVKQAEVVKLSISNMTSKYYTAIDELLTSIKKTEESLLRLKQQRKAAAGQSSVGTGTKVNEITDENKIRTQIHLDAVEYGVQITSNGLALDDFPGYLRLIDITAKSLETTALPE